MNGKVIAVDTLRALADRWATDRNYTGSPSDDIRALIDEPTESQKPEAVRLRDELRERAEFEAWARGIGAVIDADEHGNYVDSGLNHAKLGWQAALAATGRQQVGEVVTDRMVEAALQSTVAEPNVGTPWRQVVALDDHADFMADMRKAIQAAISVQPGTPDFSAATQAVADHCDRIFWRHNYYTLPLGPSDRAKPTRRRQSAVELVQKLGFQWKDEVWVQVGEVLGDALVQEALAYFERAGDAGDRKYVEAIRNALAARQPVGDSQ